MKWRTTSTFAITVGLITASVVTPACQEPIPPLPSALVVVDTDLPVPRAVERLRIDVFAEDGTWLHSRDDPRPRAEDWPVSFALFSPNETKETTVLVRLRAYPEGAIRDYRGEQYAPRPKLERVQFARSLQQLCAEAKELPPNIEQTLRRGPLPITSPLGCKPDTDPDALSEESATGSVAAKITIATRDRYRFEVVGSDPSNAIGGVDTTLFLRKNCLEVASEVACHDNIDANPDDPDAPVNLLSRLELDLDPGSYTLITGGSFPQERADLTLRWARAADWGPDGSRPVPPPPVEPARTPFPRFSRADGSDATPVSEPSPPATVDRLVRVRLKPKIARRVEVVLHGSCAGTMAKLALAEGSEGRVQAESSETCVENDLLEPVQEVPDATRAAGTPSVQGTMLNEPCAEEDSDDAIACVPGGAFVLGGDEFDGVSTIPASGLPLSVVGLHRFWMDRHEVTVRRFRAALDSGLPQDELGLFTNEESDDRATFTEKAGKLEDFPINFVSQSLAETFCRQTGGELPTEAQWEYAALAAGRNRKAKFPWGDSPPACELAVLASERDSPTKSCPTPARLPVSINDPRMANDVNAIGIVGMGGNLSEWVRDAFAPYDSACWRASGPIDSQCKDDPLVYSVRGGSFNVPITFASGVRRIPRTQLRAGFTGIRCVYRERPPSSVTP